MDTSQESPDQPQPLRNVPIEPQVQVQGRRTVEFQRLPPTAPHTPAPSIPATLSTQISVSPIQPVALDRQLATQMTHAPLPDQLCMPLPGPFAMNEPTPGPMAFHQHRTQNNLHQTLIQGVDPNIHAAAMAHAGATVASVQSERDRAQAVAEQLFVEGKRVEAAAAAICLTVAAAAASTRSPSTNSFSATACA